MTKSSKLFLDSDIIISSFISKTGAASFIVNQKDLILSISNLSEKEIRIVMARLKIERKALDKVSDNFIKIGLKENTTTIKEKYSKYTSDPNDAHIVAGAVKSKSKFLISYNLKHYKSEAIKRDFDIILTTPAKFLQYLRSRN
ncbi:MAG: PIN domain-containing protein [Patescibacteria group bacterium]